MDESEGCSGKKKKERTLKKDKSSGTQEVDLSALGQKLGHFTATQPFLVLLHCLSLSSIIRSWLEVKFWSILSLIDCLKRHG